MTTITIRWGTIRHVYPCDSATAAYVRRRYRKERTTHKKYPGFAPLGGVYKQREDARDAAAHCLLSTMAAQS